MAKPKINVFRRDNRAIARVHIFVYCTIFPFLEHYREFGAQKKSKISSLWESQKQRDSCFLKCMVRPQKQRDAIYKSKSEEAHKILKNKL